MINQNPFLTSSFKSIWLKHFNSKNDIVKSFNYFSRLEFLKKSSRLIYTNVGETHTKGIDYQIQLSEDAELDNKTLLIICLRISVKTAEIKTISLKDA